MTAPASPSVEFEALFNLRDLGGVSTMTGAVVRRGVLFRSDCLDRCTDNDIRLLTDLGIRTVLDLRGAEEVPPVPPSVGSAWRNIPLLQRAWDHDELGADANQADALEFLLAQYFGMLDAGDVIKDAVDCVSGSCGEPVLFHCAAGKDRTGLLAAIILAVLGVDDETIAHDYTRTGPAMHRFVDWLATNDPEMLQLWTGAHPILWDPPAEVILRTLEEIRRRNGTVEAYLRHVGVTEASLHQLRSNLLAEA